MALPDLTGQYIQDTYQRLLQISSSGDITDGTGSLFVPPNAISASYAVSASHEIIKEVSSSHADTASYVNPLQQDVQITGSLNYTNDGGIGSFSLYTRVGTEVHQEARLVGGDIFQIGATHKNLRLYSTNFTSSLEGNIVDIKAIGTGDTINIGHQLLPFPFPIVNTNIGNGDRSRLNIDVESTNITGSLKIKDGASGSFSGSFEGDGSGIIGVISSSYALTASFAETAQTSSYIENAQTASYIDPLHQDVHITGSTNISGSVDISLPSGSAFTITETDIDQQNRLAFEYDQGDPSLIVASRGGTSKLHLKQDLAGNGVEILNTGVFRRSVSGVNYGFVIAVTSLQPATTNQLDLGFFNRRWKSAYFYTGNKLSWGTVTTADNVALNNPNATNTLQITGSSDVTLDVKGIISASGNLFASASEGVGISHVALYNTSSGQFYYTASSAIGGGGGGSAFPFTGSAEISGSLIVNGPITASGIDVEPLPLINPIVEYDDTSGITSGTEVTLPNGLTYISSSVYEYLEIFVNGLRLRYDRDFIPVTTASVQYELTVPSGSELTYKSLKRPT